MSCAVTVPSLMVHNGRRACEDLAGLCERSTNHDVRLGITIQNLCDLCSGSAVRGFTSSPDGGVNHQGGKLTAIRHPIGPEDMAIEP